MAGSPRRTYPVTIVLSPNYSTVSPTPSPTPGAGFIVTGAGVEIIGLAIRRNLGTDEQIVNRDLPIVEFGNGSRGSKIRSSLLDGGASGRTDANPVIGQTVAAQKKHCVKASATSLD